MAWGGRLKRKPARSLGGLLLAVALVTGHLPVRRALSVHPMVALRFEVAWKRREQSGATSGSAACACRQSQPAHKRVMLTVRVSQGATQRKAASHVTSGRPNGAQTVGACRAASNCLLLYRRPSGLSGNIAVGVMCSYGALPAGWPLPFRLAIMLMEVDDAC